MRRVTREEHARHTSRGDAQRASLIRRVTREELARHTRREDAWIAVDGLVYNITPHINNHPGWGPSGSVTTVVAIMQYLGKDATLAWHAVGIHASRKVVAELRAYRIGVLAGGAADTASGPDAPERGGKQPERLRRWWSSWLQRELGSQAWSASAAGIAGFALAGAFPLMCTFWL